MSNTDDSDTTGFALGRASLHEQVLRDINILSSELTEHLSRELPGYRQLPREALEGEVRSIVAWLSRTFAEVLKTGRLPGPDELDTLADSVARRAEEGMPLGDILAAYQLGARFLFARVRTKVDSQDVDDVTELWNLLMSFLGTVNRVASSSYLSVNNAMLSESQSANQSLLEALVDGDDPYRKAAKLGLELSETYAVLALAVGAHDDERNPETDTVATRRKLRRIRGALAEITPAAMASLTGNTGMLLLPLDKHPDEDPWVLLPRLLTALERASGVEVQATAEIATPLDVSAAARLVTETLQIARRTGRTNGLVRLDDVLLEYQFSLPSAATQRLTRLLDPLDSDPVALETLRLLFEEGMNRRSLAVRLHVHPNTVDYRLRKAASVLGLNPHVPGDAQLILAAFGARATQAG